MLGNDTDAEDNTLTAILVDDVASGTLSLDDDGSFTYQPDADFSGTDSFTYTASDGTSVSNEATVTITVNAINDAPVVTDIPGETILEGTSFATVPLDDYVSDVDDTDAQMTWSYTGTTDLVVSIDARHPRGHHQRSQRRLERGGDHHLHGHRPGPPLRCR